MSDFSNQSQFPDDDAGYLSHVDQASSSVTSRQVTQAMIENDRAIERLAMLQRGQLELNRLLAKNIAEELVAYTVKALTSIAQQLELENYQATIAAIRKKANSLAADSNGSSKLKELLVFMYPLFISFKENRLTRERLAKTLNYLVDFENPKRKRSFLRSRTSIAVKRAEKDNWSECQRVAIIAAGWPSVKRELRAGEALDRSLTLYQFEAEKLSADEIVDRLKLHPEMLNRYTHFLATHGRNLVTAGNDQRKFSGKHIVAMVQAIPDPAARAARASEVLRASQISNTTLADVWRNRGKEPGAFATLGNWFRGAFGRVPDYRGVLNGEDLITLMVNTEFESPFEVLSAAKHSEHLNTFVKSQSFKIGGLRIMAAEDLLRGNVKENLKGFFECIYTIKQAQAKVNSKELTVQHLLAINEKVLSLTTKINCDSNVDYTDINVNCIVNDIFKQHALTVEQAKQLLLHLMVQKFVNSQQQMAACLLSVQLQKYIFTKITGKEAAGDNQTSDFVIAGLRTQVRYGKYNFEWEDKIREMEQAFLAEDESARKLMKGESELALAHFTMILYARNSFKDDFSKNTGGMTKFLQEGNHSGLVNVLKRLYDTFSTASFPADEAFVKGVKKFYGLDTQAIEEITEKDYAKIVTACSAIDSASAREVALMGFRCLCWIANKDPEAILAENQVVSSVAVVGEQVAKEVNPRPAIVIQEQDYDTWRKTAEEFKAKVEKILAGSQEFNVVNIIAEQERIVNHRCASRYPAIVDDIKLMFLERKDIFSSDVKNRLAADAVDRKSTDATVHFVAEYGLMGERGHTTAIDSVDPAPEVTQSEHVYMHA